MKNVFIDNSNHLHSNEESDISISLFSNEPIMEKATTHQLFKSETMRKLFEGLDLDIARLSMEQSDLLDQIYQYLLKGGRKDLPDLLPILTSEHQDLWISLRGSRRLIIKYRMENLFQLDFYLADSGKKMLKDLYANRKCD